MKEMQFTAVVLMTLLTLKLLMLPVKVTSNVFVNNSRWLMACGTALVAVQFLLQHALGLRDIGITQAVLLNLILFMPASWLFSLSILFLQRQGRLNWVDKYLGFFAWMVVLILLGVTITTDHRPLMMYSHLLYRTEIVSSGFFAISVTYYAWRHLYNLRAMRHALQNYYDSDTDYLLRWMQLGVLILPIMGLMVPLLIFIESPLLATAGLLFFGGIFYLVDSFCSYVVSSAPAKVREAEESEDLHGDAMDEPGVDRESISSALDTSSLSPDNMQRVERAVKQWMGNGGHLKNGLKLPNVAEEVGVPQYLLTTWLRHKNLKYNEWMTGLRLEEARRVLIAHPEWSNEAVALHCGFSDRSYFLRKFKEEVGLSPAEYVRSL